MSRPQESVTVLPTLRAKTTRYAAALTGISQKLPLMRAAIKTPLGSLHPLQMSSLEIRALACRLLILFRKKRCKEFLKTCAFRPRSPFNIEFERLSISSAVYNGTCHGEWT